MDAKELVAKCNAMRESWSARNKKIVEWYDMLTLKDKLAQEGMESVVSNDPRTGYNLGKYLMTSSIIAHKIDTDGLSPAEIDSTSYLEKYITGRWTAEEQRYRRAGRQSLIGEIASYMLGTGWFSVFAMATEDSVRAEVLNPIEVFPEFGPDGLVRVSNIYSMTPAVANRKLKMMGWSVKRPISHNTYLYNYWDYDNDGDVVNGIVIGDEFVKPLTKEPELSELHIIPVLVSPVGGLPDRGSILSQSGKWQEYFGESIVAVNANLADNYNRLLTFIQQVIRDTANPRWFEQSNSDTPILREEDMFKRGAVFRGGLGELVQALPMPAMPVEARQMLFDYQNMLQRGMFPWVIFGNVQQQMSYIAMANIASSALQILTPYMEAFRGIMSDIDNLWYKLISKGGYKPFNFKPPNNLPKEFEFTVQADIEIPGYLVQRATVARMLDPNFRLPTSMVADKLFPEVKDPLKAQAQVRRDDAMMHPKAIMADQVIAYREYARSLREVGDVDSAMLYEKLASSIEAELVGVPTQGRTSQPSNIPPEVSREVLPQEATAPTEGLVQGV